ncbi:MAG TPA: heparan-alpha-glucosaminide N-acetyltransferase domain-containing protein [Polyangia bacterium]|nr:heparan-alpha-glucosaminide N-acetyltransferase domain-containing protein [Polyangia bacterium]
MSADAPPPTSPSSRLDAPATSRLDAIDWLRGLAVVLMIQTHLYDSWVSPAGKATPTYWWTRYWGGVPSRLFLLLVGVSLAIRFEAQLRKGIERAAMVRGAARRGLEILALAYLFRFQEYALSGFWGPPDDLFRVDILNCIGVSMMVVAVVAAPRAGKPQYLVALLAAAFFLGLGPILGPAHFPTFIPRPITSYLGGQRPMSWFGLFPWGAWAFTGLAVGHLWVRASATPGRAARAYLLTGAVGLALMGAVLAVRAHNPYIIRYPNEIVQQMGPGTFFYRLGLCGVLAFVAYAVSRLVAGRFSFMRQLGRTSLLVYWIHVDLCYGVVSKPLHGKLTMRQATIGFVLMTIAMLLVSIAKTRYWEPWRRKQLARAPRPIPRTPNLV